MLAGRTARLAPKFTLCVAARRLSPFPLSRTFSETGRKQFRGSRKPRLLCRKAVRVSNFETFGPFYVPIQQTRRTAGTTADQGCRSFYQSCWQFWHSARHAVETALLIPFVNSETVLPRKSAFEERSSGNASTANLNSNAEPAERRSPKPELAAW